MNFNKYKNLKKLYDIEIDKKCQLDVKKLITGHKKSLGRSQGKIVSWHRGGGVKRNFRKIYNNSDVSSNTSLHAIVRSINYNPNSSSFIGVIQFENAAFAYTPITSKIKINDIIIFSNHENNIIKNGDNLQLRYIPIGIPIYNIEKYPGSGPIYTKAGGTVSTLISKDDIYAKVKLSSGEERLFDLNCFSTVGTPSNTYNKFHKYYKAGTRRLLNRRPVVRGVAMNPIDHPHGGGEGKSGSGRPCVSPWGKLTKNVPTRHSNKNKFIVKTR